MPVPKLPLRLRVDIRDLFDIFDSPAQKALRTLEGIIGMKTLCNVDWRLLYNVLESSLADNSTFVPIIVNIIVTWCDVFFTRLEDRRFESWTENVLDMLGHVGIVKLRFQTLDISRVMSSWSLDDESFVLSLPRNAAFSPNGASSAFEADFASLFTTEPSAASTESMPFRPKDDDWTDMEDHSEAGIVGLPTTTTKVDSKEFPAVEALPSPEILLGGSTPYILRVTQKSSGKLAEHGITRSFTQGQGRSIGQSSSAQVEQTVTTLVIQGTHGPTLQFLHQYLTRWIKKDHQDSRKASREPPLLRITLRESHFGLGINYDTLTIEPYDTTQERRGVEMNPTIVLALIENVLGYSRLPSISDGAWEFRRDTAFR